MSKLANLRRGIPEHKIVTFPGTEEEVAIVALNTSEIIESREQAMNYMKYHPVDADTGDLILSIYTLLKAMKNPNDLEEPFADSFEEIRENTTPKEVYELQRVFLEVQNGKAEELGELNNEEFEDIKKKLNQTPLNELDGELQTVLKYFHQILASKDLQKDN